MEIRCLKSILNVAERAKKVKTAIYQALERVRDEGAAGSNPVTSTISSVHNVYEVMNTRFFCFYAVLVVLKYSTSTPFLVLTFILSKFSGISSSPMNL